MKLAIQSSCTMLLLFAGIATADVSQYAVKKVNKDAPKDLPEATRKLFGKEALQFTTKDGKLIAEIWLAEKILGDVKVKAGKKLQYGDIPQAAIIGTVKLAQPWKDYRKQKLPKGVYTMRFATQPQDGDHMGTAPHPSFVVLTAVKFDPKTDAYPFRELSGRSSAGIGTTHPAVWLLFPNAKGAKAKLAARENDHVILSVAGDVSASGKKTSLPLGLTLVGHADE